MSYYGSGPEILTHGFTLSEKNTRTPRVFTHRRGHVFWRKPLQIVFSGERASCTAIVRPIIHHTDTGFIQAIDSVGP
jgi:hypothetical protein